MFPLAVTVARVSVSIFNPLPIGFRLFHAVVPSPTFKILLVVSNPGSPSANTGLLLQSSPLLNLITLLTGIVCLSYII